jgi:hypothetical protein
VLNEPSHEGLIGADENQGLTYRCLEARRAGSPNISPARKGWVSVDGDAERRRRGTHSSLSFPKFERRVGSRPIMWKSGWGSRAAEFATFRRSFGVITGAKGAAPTALAIFIHCAAGDIDTQPFRAGLHSLAGRPSGPRELLGSLLRFSHAGANQALALPATGEAKQ